MKSFTFKRSQNVEVPETSTMRPFLDRHGNPLCGEEIVKRVASQIRKYEKDNDAPFPHPDRKFIDWWLQADEEIRTNGTSYADIVRKTVIAR